MTTTVVESENKKDIPSWNPANADSYSFKKYTEDVEFWLLTTNLKPTQIVPCLIRKLEGVAYEVGKSMTTDEMQNGGRYKGELRPAIELLMLKLDENFGLTDAEAEAIA